MMYGKKAVSSGHTENNKAYKGKYQANRQVSYNGNWASKYNGSCSPGNSQGSKGGSAGHGYDQYRN